MRLSRSCACSAAAGCIGVTGYRQVFESSSPHRRRVHRFTIGMFFGHVCAIQACDAHTTVHAHGRCLEGTCRPGEQDALTLTFQSVLVLWVCSATQLIREMAKAKFDANQIMELIKNDSTKIGWLLAGSLGPFLGSTRSKLMNASKGQLCVFLRFVDFHSGRCE